MASRSFRNYLVVLLQDAEELIQAHAKLRTGQRGRQWKLGALNRAVVLMCVSAWEAYVEELAKEALESFRPTMGAVSQWQSLNAACRSQIGRFNTPNSQNVRLLIADAIGLQNVTDSWHWQNCTVVDARRRLDEVLDFRHKIAHGVNPRPIIHNQWVGKLPTFFRILGRCTDKAVRHYLRTKLGVKKPW